MPKVKPFERIDNAFRAARAIRDLEAIYGRPPTLERLNQELGYRNRSCVYTHIHHAMRIGLIEKDDTVNYGKYRLTPGASERIDDHYFGPADGS